MGSARTGAVALSAIALSLVVACNDPGSPPQPDPAKGPPTLRFEVLPVGVQSNSVIIAGPKVTSSFGSTSLGYARAARVPTSLPYVSPPLEVSDNARYEMRVSIAGTSLSALGLPTQITCRVLFRDAVIYERTAHSCDVQGRL